MGIQEKHIRLEDIGRTPNASNIISFYERYQRREDLDQKSRMPSGWYILPSVILGALIWAFVLWKMLGWLL